MTADEQAELRAVAQIMRMVAERAGPMHAWWDVISDLECLAEYRRPIVAMSATEYIEYAWQLMLE